MAQEKAMQEPKVTPALAEEHGLTPEEFDTIKSILGRDPLWADLRTASLTPLEL